MNKVSIAEMWLLYSTCDKTINDKIRNDNIKESVRVSLIVEKMVKIYLGIQACRDKNYRLCGKESRSGRKETHNYRQRKPKKL